MSSNKRPQRETNASAVRVAVTRQIDQAIVAQGDLAFPCIPAMLDTYLRKLAIIFEALGQPFTPQDLDALRAVMSRTLAEGYKSFPYGKVIVNYLRRPDRPGISWNVGLKQETMADHYQNWVGDDKASPFGKFADAKVVAVAAELGERREAPVLDIGAGTGRNALALARLGHPVDALEPTPALAGAMREVVEAENLAVNVLEYDVFSSQLALPAERYKLVVLSEVVTHFRGVEQLQRLFEALVGCVAPGGLVLLNAFLAMDGYKPDALALEASETAWSYIYTRADLKRILDALPFERVSDESALEFEQQHLPAEGWPPTPWFVRWSQARDVFALPAGKAPVELRWLLLRKRA